MAADDPRDRRGPRVGRRRVVLRGDVLAEIGVGVLYVVIGMSMLSFFEWESRRRATLELF